MNNGQFAYVNERDQIANILEDSKVAGSQATLASMNIYKNIQLIPKTEVSLTHQMSKASAA